MSAAVPPDLPGSLLASLRARHEAPGRAYHGWAHVMALLGHLDRERPLVHDPRAAGFAVLYHDAVYDPARGDNEARSADLALAELAGLLDPGTAGRVRTLVLATRDHRVPDGLAPDEAADVARFLDWDLSILGAGPEAFAAYEAGIRAEYAHVPEAAYRAGRAEVLERFLERAPIYRTRPSRGLYEARARENLARAVAALRDGPDPGAAPAGPAP